MAGAFSTPPVTPCWREFPSAVEAVRCAIDILEGLRTRRGRREGRASG
jgi:hypothetical protein